MSMLTSVADRVDTVRVTATTVIGIGAPGTKGAQPPRGFFCAHRSCKPHRWAGRGSLRARRFLWSGTPTPFGPAASIGVVVAGHNPLPKEPTMACKPPAPAPGVVVRLPTPVITPEELLADIAAQQPAPASSREALALAALTLAESLKQLLDGFPYRNNPAHPAAVWARLTALTLER